MSLVLTALSSTGKTFKTHFDPVFFMLLIEKFFEILSKHSIYGFISQSFSLN